MLFIDYSKKIALILALSVFIVISSIPSINIAYAAEEPHLYDIRIGNGEIIRPTNVYEAEDYFVQLPYGVDKIQIYIPQEQYSSIPGKTPQWEDVTLLPDDCDYNNGWWTVDLSTGYFEINYWGNATDYIYDGSLIDEQAKHCMIMPDNNYWQYLVIQIGGKGDPLPVYLVNDENYIRIGSDLAFTKPTNLYLKTGRNLKLYDTNQDIWYTTDGTDPKESDSAVKYTKGSPIDFTCNTTLTARTKIDNAWGELSKYDVFVRPVAPTVSLKSGDYLGEQAIELSHPDDVSKIYYTLDGSDPDKSSTLYEHPIIIDKDTNLKAVAYVGEMSPSKMADETYRFSRGLTLDLQEGSKGSWMGKQLLSTQNKAFLYAPFGTVKCDLVANIPNGASLKVDGKTIEKNDEGKYTFSINTHTMTNKKDEEELEAIKTTLSVTVAGESIDYTVYCIAASCDGLPDEISDYFCIGSQYTNGVGGFGGNIEATLVEGAGVYDSTSLGNFGGYATWYYENGITNDPHNPYGVDFIVIGNSADGTNEFAEPGNVMVSEDGKTWYTLAGSLHYDGSATWNQRVTYTKSTNTPGKTDVDLEGIKKGTLEKYAYPLKSAYPQHKNEDDFTSFTTVGTFLHADSGTNEFGNTRPPYPAFGYADVGLCNSYSNEAENIYAGLYKGGMVNHPFEYRILSNRNGDGFDLDWAVDAEGKPVKLNTVHYIKIQTATLIDNSAINEKSTEVCCIRKAKPESSNVGVTDEPASIMIDGTVISGESLQIGTIKDVEVNGIFDIKVNASENANIYINSIKSDVAYMDKAPHGIVRVIVQEGKKAPAIYYFNIKQSEQPASKKVTKVILDSNDGLMNDKVKLSCFFDKDTLAHIGGDEEEIIFDTPRAQNDTLAFLRWSDSENKSDSYDRYNSSFATKFDEVTLTAVYVKIKDQEAAKAVDDMINELPDAADVAVTDAEDISKADTAYNDLSDKQKDLVDPAALQKLENVKAALFTALVKEIPDEVTEKDEETLSAAQDVYDALPDDLKEQAAAGYIKLVEAKLSVAMDKLAKANTEITEKQKDIEAKQKVIDAKQKDIDELTEKLNDKIAELEKANEEDIPALKTEIAGLEQRLAKADSDLEKANAEIAKLRKELVDNTVKDLIASAEKMLASIEENLKEAGDSISTKTIKALVDTAEKMLDVAKAKVEETNEVLAENAREIAALREQVAQATSDLAKAGTDLADAIASGLASEAEIAELRGKLNDAEAAKEEAEQAVQKALEEKQSSDEALKAAQKSLDDALAELQKVRDELKQVREQAEKDLTAAEQARDQALKDKDQALKDKEQAEKERDAAVEAASEISKKLISLQNKIAAANFKVKGFKVSCKSGKFTLTWTRNTEADGYKVQYRKKGAKKYKTLKVTTKTKVTKKNLKVGKEYQFRVRTYKKVDEKKVYGKWTKAKTVKCK